MKKLGVEINNGEKFKYVVIKHPIKRINKSEKMILSILFDSKKHKLDMKYYFQDIISPCARFVNGEFEKSTGEYKDNNKMTQKKAERHIENMIIKIEDSISNGNIKDYFKRKRDDVNISNNKKRKMV